MRKQRFEQKELLLDSGSFVRFCSIFERVAQWCQVQGHSCPNCRDYELAAVASSAGITLAPVRLEKNERKTRKRTMLTAAPSR